MAVISESEYQAAIPDCCVLRTTKEHVDVIALCWGLTSAIAAKHEMHCGSCEFATRMQKGGAA